MAALVERCLMNELSNNPMAPRTYRVRRKRRELSDTFTFLLEPAAGDSLPLPAPGQFNMLYMFGVGEVPISSSGDPADTGGLVHTIRSVGAVTAAICKMKRGDAVGIRGPFGAHWRVDEAEGRDVIIVAGGLGLAPLRPVIYHIIAHRGRYERVALLYGARSPNDLLYRREIEEWRGRFDLKVEVTVDTAERDWRGNVGVVTTLVSEAQFDPERATAMVCGPEVMMRFTIRELQKCGLAAENILLSMERNMKCAIGFCGRCQFGPTFICKDGPVLRYDRISHWFGKREI
jgi:NAD(P)H-flavin reductase